MQLIDSTNPILHTKAEPVDAFGGPLSLLCQEMQELMVKSGGIGLAAPQVGISKRIFVMTGNRFVINPTITWMSIDKWIAKEGCLSYPDLHIPVARAVQIEVEYYSPSGELQTELLNGMDARCFQHESDHLDGVCFTDGLSPLKLNMLLKKSKKGTK
jgi:peptide deformylase